MKPLPDQGESALWDCSLQVGPTNFSRGLETSRLQWQSRCSLWRQELSLTGTLSFPNPSRINSRHFLAHQSAETGPTVCGYMGLDGASGNAPETQKLNFEEQPDSRVRLN